MDIFLYFIECLQIEAKQIFSNVDYFLKKTYLFMSLIKRASNLGRRSPELSPLLTTEPSPGSSEGGRSWHRSQASPSPSCASTGSLREVCSLWLCHEGAKPCCVDKLNIPLCPVRKNIFVKEYVHEPINKKNIPRISFHKLLAHEQRRRVVQSLPTCTPAPRASLALGSWPE